MRNAIVNWMAFHVMWIKIACNCFRTRSSYSRTARHNFVLLCFTRNAMVHTMRHCCSCWTNYFIFFAFFPMLSLSPSNLQGFTFPDEAGYPIESRQAKYYLMETHYNNLQPDFTQLHARQMADNSGLKIYFTHVLRPNDAGVLSIGEYDFYPIHNIFKFTHSLFVCHLPTIDQMWSLDKSIGI